MSSSDLDVYGTLPSYYTFPPSRTRGFVAPRGVVRPVSPRYVYEYGYRSNRYENPTQ